MLRNTRVSWGCCAGWEQPKTELDVLSICPTHASQMLVSIWRAYKTQIPGLTPSPRNSDSVGPGWSLRICLSNQLTGDEGSGERGMDHTLSATELEARASGQRQFGLPFAL